MFIKLPELAALLADPTYPTLPQTATLTLNAALTLMFTLIPQELAALMVDPIPDPRVVLNAIVTLGIMMRIRGNLEGASEDIVAVGAVLEFCVRHGCAAPGNDLEWLAFGMGSFFLWRHIQELNTKSGAGSDPIPLLDRVEFRAEPEWETSR